MWLLLVLLTTLAFLRIGSVVGALCSTDELFGMLFCAGIFVVLYLFGDISSLDASMLSLFVEDEGYLLLDYVLFLLCALSGYVCLFFVM